MQNIFFFFFLLLSVDSDYISVLSSLWQVSHLGPLLHSAERGERSELQSHIRIHTNMRTHADACKHLLCVHNAAKYSLDFFQPSQNLLPSCMPFPQDAKVPHYSFVAFQGCYRFFSVNISNLNSFDLPKHKQNRYILLRLHLDILIWAPSTIRILGFGGCLYCPLLLLLWRVRCAWRSGSSSSTTLSHEQNRKQDQATDEKRETVLDRDLFLFCSSHGTSRVQLWTSPSRKMQQKYGEEKSQTA